ncbi:MFS transporter [Saccharothrix syringae]|uniref:MFS transporter n=1 Tax=Saccharothrix syringae TaxID=103733 RepID=A0A5Q0H3K1_SACSY|nr:MFS transporter [Saccharothrix syringae]QFZ20791.1 MFS transporter [Saccharothrix syringae]
MADIPTRRPRLAAAASYIGSALEYYDFFIYGSASALVFGKLFFPHAAPAVGTLAALGTFAAGYLARPLGAALAGHFGDRLGRKKVLVGTMIAMGVCTFAIGCLPTYATLGVAAPILLLVLRLAQGMAVAGELGGATSLSLEHAPQDRRAFFTCWVNQGATTGALLAGVAFLGFSRLDAESFLSWGWRVPFWLSAALVVAGVVIRAKLPESPEFAEVERGAAVERFPLRTVLARQPAAVLRVIGSAVLTVTVPINQVFALSYGISHGIPRSTMLVIGLVGMGSMLITQPFFAIAADRFGRKPVFTAGGVVIAASAFPFFTGLANGDASLALVGSLVMMPLGNAMCSAVAPSLWSEMFGTGVRYSGTAFANALGQVFPGFAPTIAAGLVAGGGGPTGLAVFVGGCAVFGILVIATARETRGLAMDQLGAPGTAARPRQPARLDPAPRT